MAKETPFFKFDSSSWLGGSIQFTDLTTKGLFIDLCAIYWESQKPIQIDKKLKVRTRCDEGTLTDLIETLAALDIISQTEHGITIPFLDSLISERNEFLEKCSKAGKKSARVKGSSTNKKEERRKKREESREENNRIEKIKGCDYIEWELFSNYLDVRRQLGVNESIDDYSVKLILETLSNNREIANDVLKKAVMNKTKSIDWAIRDLGQQKQKYYSEGRSNA